MANLDSRLKKMEQRLAPRRMPELTLVFTWHTPEGRERAEAAAERHNQLNADSPRLPGQGIIHYRAQEFKRK